MVGSVGAAWQLKSGAVAVTVTPEAGTKQEIVAASVVVLDCPHGAGPRAFQEERRASGELFADVRRLTAELKRRRERVSRDLEALAQTYHERADVLGKIAASHDFDGETYRLSVKRALAAEDEARDLAQRYASGALD